MWRGCDVSDLTAHNIRPSRAASGSSTASSASPFRESGRSDAFHTRHCTISSILVRTESFLTHIMYYLTKKQVGIDQYYDNDLDPQRRNADIVAQYFGAGDDKSPMGRS
ncbi:hypothetical protein Y032_0040g217 [Ancylostoma ceylanicum]|uniref:Uncharacterized protein n=1 Tax=Ancylostoma ceylanicum TaxID=53326 RepID=A0A016UHX3_9BILA|nr:hypothetical protein Y032_0040g217 [Ancylostoma ceylanicum]